MPKICYEQQKFNTKNRERLDHILEILKEYEAADAVLTLRALYYQLVSKNIIANEDSEYKSLGNLVVKARKGGFIDWEQIVDETRILQYRTSWESPADSIISAAETYHRDYWEDQEYYIETWVEKLALLSVIERAAYPLDCPYYTGRGFNSVSSSWAAAMRFKEKIEQGKEAILIYCGDHDPAGLQIPKNIQEDFDLFNVEVTVKRIALNKDQIEYYNLPPNPTKKTDKKAEKYIAQYGPEAWELDALPMGVLESLVKDEIKKFIDVEKFNNAIEQQEAEQGFLARCFYKD